MIIKNNPKIKYDINLMKFISLFETLTRSKVKDCIDGNPLIFVVQQGEIAKAIGKKGSNIRKIEGVLRKKIRIIEYNDDLEVFVKNVIAPIKVENITNEDGLVTITDPSTKTKGMIIGRNSSNLQNYKEIVKMLLKHPGIEVNIIDMFKRSALSIAKSKKFAEIISMLEKAGATS